MNAIQFTYVPATKSCLHILLGKRNRVDVYTRESPCLFVWINSVVNRRKGDSFCNSVSSITRWNPMLSSKDQCFTQRHCVLATMSLVLN